MLSKELLNLISDLNDGKAMFFSLCLQMHMQIVMHTEEDGVYNERSEVVHPKINCKTIRCA
jgi:hypothetical protein